MNILFVIPCTFQIDEEGPSYKGLAICSDPDTPETFIFEDGEPLLNKEIWSYNLHHHEPWSKFEFEFNS